MPKITIDGRECEFQKGQMILQVANAHGIEIPQYCYHDGLSIVGSCRICLAEVWAPNPKHDNTLEPIPKLLPTCSTPAGEGQVVYTNSPRAIANQKAVMEYLLINHPLDCPVCDKSGECLLQDYSYEYGRGVSRFKGTKVKQPKKNLGPHVYLYADRCIMCSRCVRFCREVTETSELIVQGRGNTEQIDIFPGLALDNELSANVIDLCPVGALTDKDFLFTQRVWFLKRTPTIDGITASGDNIWIEHNQGKIYRITPRTNPEVNKWWISDEIRYGWRFVHREDRLVRASHARMGRREACDFGRAYHEAVNGLSEKKILLMVSPMLPCEEAYLLARASRALDPDATLAIGPIPRQGEDKTFPGGYTIRAEKCPNSRGVRRVLEAVAEDAVVLKYEDVVRSLGAGRFTGAIITGNYPSEWVTEELAAACKGAFVLLIDTLPNRLTERADVVLPGATWAEKGGVFENADNRLQAFEQAIPVLAGAQCEGQIAMDLLAMVEGVPMSEIRADATVLVVDEQAGQVPASTSVVMPRATLRYNAASVRREIAAEFTPLSRLETDVQYAAGEARQQADMEVVEL